MVTLIILLLFLIGMFVYVRYYNLETFSGSKDIFTMAQTKLMDTLKKTEGKVIYSGVSTKQNYPIGITNNIQASTDNKDEINLILNEFSNEIQPYTIQNINLDNIKLNITSSTDKLVKTFVIPLIILDTTNTLSISQRVILHTQNTFKDNTLSIQVLQVEIPKDTSINIPIVKGLVKSKFGKFNKRDFSDDLLLTPENIKNEQKRQELIKQLQSSYFCFGIPEAGKVGDQQQCELFGGVWDRKAQNNIDCPFYQVNKNYTNQRGGKNIGGYCELPRNMKNVGFTQYSHNPLDQPLCYNCKTGRIGQGTLGNCCLQQTNKTIYPTLLSPDYAFNGDILERTNASAELVAKNLSII